LEHTFNSGLHLLDSMDKSLYCIERPAKSSKDNAFPLFLIHGYGSDENDLFSFAERIPDHYHIISVRAPYPMQPYGNAWYAINFDAEKGKWSDLEQAVISRDLLHDFIQEKCKERHLDRNKICVLGFSQGSILSYALAFQYPEFYHKFICLSGYINESLAETKGNIEAYKNIHIFASHGTQDQVIPFDWAEKIPSQLNAIGIDHSFKSYPIGHGVSPQNFADLLEWLQ
jgi:phospholipase/carboxylesterase